MKNKKNYHKVARDFSLSLSSRRKKKEVKVVSIKQHWQYVKIKNFSINKYLKSSTR